MHTLPPVEDTPEVLRAKAEYFEALIDRDQLRAKAAFAAFARDPRLQRPQTQAERDKWRVRMPALVKLIEGLRQHREEERRGIVRPPATPLTPEQEQEADEVVERFGRWIRDDDSAGPFE